MKLSKKQREQVVELLRCAADLAETGRYSALFGGPAVAAARCIKPASAVSVHASKAARDAAPRGEKEGARNADDFIGVALEAAARVEEGSWP